MRMLPQMRQSLAFLYKQVPYIYTTSSSWYREKVFLPQVLEIANTWIYNRLIETIRINDERLISSCKPVMGEWE